MASGAASLTNAELIAVILRTGTSGASAVDLARRVLEIRGPGREALSVLYDLTMEDLTSIRGIGQVKAVKLLCLAEMSRRLYREGARPSLVFTSPETVARYYMEQLRHERQETVLLLLLDNAMALIREETLSIGTVNAALVSPREILSILYCCTIIQAAIRLPAGRTSGSPERSSKPAKCWRSAWPTIW